MDNSFAEKGQPVVELHFQQSLRGTVSYLARQTTFSFLLFGLFSLAWGAHLSCPCERERQNKSTLSSTRAFVDVVRRLICFLDTCLPFFHLFSQSPPPLSTTYISSQCSSPNRLWIISTWKTQLKSRVFKIRSLASFNCSFYPVCLYFRLITTTLDELTSELLYLSYCQ